MCGFYDPQLAQKRTLKRPLKPKPKRVGENTRNAVKLMLEMDWSPEQILAICKRLGYPVSHEWIYNYVLADFYRGGGLFTQLRHRLKRYKKRLYRQRGRILGRRSIHDRPAIIDNQGRYGDWEIDTVIGKRGTGAIVTLLERKSRFYLVKKVTSKQADAVANATIEMLQPFKSPVHSITADNESANGLLRQYVPKGTDLRTVTKKLIAKYQQRLNLRPRKRLGFIQPDIIFTEQLQQAMSECCSY